MTVKNQEPSSTSQEKKKDTEPVEVPAKQAVRVRAVKTKIWHPKLEQNMVFHEGDVIKNPWPELIKLAEEDKEHRTLVIIKADSR